MSPKLLPRRGDREEDTEEREGIAAGRSIGTGEEPDTALGGAAEILQRTYRQIKAEDTFLTR
jgi:hypothetical protein